MQVKNGFAGSLWRAAPDRISCHCFALSDGYAYFSNWFYNGLFKVDLRTGETYFLGCFEGEKLSEENLHWKTLLRDGRVCFLPKLGRHVHLYNLSDGSVERVEIRSSSEAFFRIGEVVLGDGWVALFPEEKGNLARKVDLETYAVTEFNQREELQGERHIQRFRRWNEDTFPGSVLFMNYGVYNAGGVSWELLPDGGWCGFFPMGRQLIRYFEETKEFLAIPLTVVNREELESHLRKVKESLLQSCFGEARMGLSMFLEEVSGRAMHGAGDVADGGIGSSVWKHIRENFRDNGEDMVHGSRSILPSDGRYCSIYCDKS